MVWRGDSSPLYGAVLKHNNSVNQTSDKRCDTIPKEEITVGAAPCCEKEKPRADDEHCRKAEPQPKKCCNPQRQNAPATFSARPLSDKDSLLLIAVIILLMNENADKKLILALAYVLLF